MKDQTISQPIRRLLKRMHAEYTDSLTLHQPYQYLFGNPVQPVVPLDLAQDSVFIIGAYPTARFATMKGERDVPVADISGPFSTERYFDGSAIRVVNSGDELNKAYLAPLGLTRDQCWISNLVKIFLFKEGHINKYRRLGCDWPPGANRKEFEQYAQEGQSWLVEEIKLARPRVIITLGAEVAGVLQGVKGRKKRNDLLGGEVKTLIIGSEEYKAIHFAHPGIVMRKATERNPWPRRHHEEHIPTASKNVKDLLA